MRVGLKPTPQTPPQTQILPWHHLHSAWHPALYHQHRPAMGYEVSRASPSTALAPPARARHHGEAQLMHQPKSGWGFPTHSRHHPMGSMLLRHHNAVATLQGHPQVRGPHGCTGGVGTLGLSSSQRQSQSWEVGVNPSRLEQAMSQWTLFCGEQATSHGKGCSERSPWLPSW